MSEPAAYPVFRTTQLLEVGDQRYAEVSVDVELRTVREVLRIREKGGLDTS
ncbi:hypothetical protein [Streptomyces sp. NPDC086835]|jgi:hypothetical protein|uniref:hypothetical protein n=1 Tax=Streptomyces sp. NPDC086835 TaxID=3365761 RepID=UPI0037F19858